MRWAVRRASAWILFFIPAAAGLANGRDLTFQERVTAQEAIEHVYYSHQTGTRKPFEVAVPRELLERKVRAYLKETVALERFWKTPVTSDALRRETERMVRQSHMRERLRELFAAIGNDPFLIQECLVRPALVSRLTGNFFAYDRTIHAAESAKAEALRNRLTNGQLDPSTQSPFRRVLRLVRGDPDGENGSAPDKIGESLVSGLTDPAPIELPTPEYDRWRAEIPSRAGEIGPLVEKRETFSFRVLLEENANEVRVAVYSIEKRTWDDWWKAVEGSLGESSVKPVASGEGPHPSLMAPGEKGGGRRDGAVLTGPSTLSPSTVSSCIPDDTWDNGSLDDVPGGREMHTAIWTGNEMIVWGGFSEATLLVTSGGRYDPATDTWTRVSNTGAPGPRWNHTAVWTGSEMIVWGGYSDQGGLPTGRRYDPLTDSWTPLAPSGPDIGGQGHTAVWTGSEMIVWGGYHYGEPRSGGRYVPLTDSWFSLATPGPGVGAGGHTAVWTGTEMIVWRGGNSLDSGGRYDPTSDSWAPISIDSAPAGRSNHTAVWTGSEMIIWGGGNSLDSGGRYDPVADSWTPTSTAGAPGGRAYHTAVWTGAEVIVWGGRSASTSVATGGRYNPVSDTWAATASTNAPTARSHHTALWSGSLMIVWGGGSNSGGRYDPTSDTWTPTSLGQSPEGRSGQSAVWTGNEMVIWGGFGFDYFLTQNTGGRYDPSTDTWTPTSAGTDAPAGRTDHTAVWTGEEMIVWGGRNGSTFESDGGRYNPISNTWAPVSVSGAPEAGAHTAVWTGIEMIVWGGGSNSGGRYAPTSDSWTAVSHVGAPTYGGATVWTGSLMLTWAGRDSPGGRYDPVSDLWTPMSTTDAPFSSAPKAVWTGSLMIVWGGRDGIDKGGRYDPITDTWTPITMVNNSRPRHSHAVVWTGREMVIWGGYDYFGLDSGGRYDPVADDWVDTSLTNAPPPRSGPTAVWTGSLMIVWGGMGLSSGGRYALGQSMDDDGDGFSECGGDCNDGNVAIHPDAPEVCDGIDDNCDGQVDEDSAGVDTDGDGVHNSCDNCPALSNPGQDDFDHDSEGDECDLDDGMILFTDVAAGGVKWQQETTYERFNLYRGSLERLRSMGEYTQDPAVEVEAARWCGLTVHHQADSHRPQVGQVNTYLLTGTNGTLESSLGTTSDGMPRPNTNPCP